MDIAGELTDPLRTHAAIRVHIHQRIQFSTH